MVRIIRQNLQNHGSDIGLVSIDANNTIKVRLQCKSGDCPEAKEVLETGVKELMKQRIRKLENSLLLINYLSLKPAFNLAAEWL